MEYHIPRYIESCFLDGRVPRLVRFCCIDGEYATIPRAMHVHGDSAEITFIAAGRGSHIIGDHILNTKPGDILIYNAGIPHEERPIGGEPLHMYVCSITNLRLKGLPENFILPSDFDPILHMSGKDGRIRHLFGMLHATMEQEGPYVFEQARFLMVCILLEVLEHARVGAVKSKQDPQALGLRIKQYIDNKYLESLTLQSMAEELGISPYYLGRLFKEKTGYSPMQYVITRRMGDAQSLLILTDDPVSTVAERVGYENPNYFNLLFKKNIGVTPGQYRKIAHQKRTNSNMHNKNMTFYSK